MTKKRLTIALSALVALIVSCLPISQTDEIREVEASRRNETGEESPARPTVDVEYSDSGDLALTLYQEAVCYQEEWVTYHREDIVTRTTNTYQLTIYWVGGLACLGIGTGALIAAPGASTEPGVDEQTGQETASDQDMLYLVGGLGMAVGAAATALAIGNSVSAMDRVDELADDERLENRTTAPCNHEPYSNQPVTGSMGGTTIALGTTDATGRLVIRPIMAIPRELVTGPDPVVAMVVECDGQRIGTVDLEPYRAQIESNEWENASGPLESIEGWQSYLDEFPDSYRSTDAQAAVLRLRREAQAAEVQAAWAEATAEDDMENYLTFIEAYPESEEATTARVDIVQRLYRAGRYDDATQRLSEWSLVDPAVAAQAGTLAQDIQNRQREERERDRNEALSSISQAIEHCTSGGGCSAANAEQAGEAYRQLDSSRGLLSEEEIGEREMSVLSRCGCTRSAAGQ